MSIPIGEKIRNVRESLGMGRQEFAIKTGIPKGTLIGAEQGNREPKAGILIAIAKIWPKYAAYLLTDEINIPQEDPTHLYFMGKLMDPVQLNAEPVSEKEIKDFVDGVMKQLKAVPLNLRPAKEIAETKIRKKLWEAVQEAEKKSLLKKSHGTK